MSSDDMTKRRKRRPFTKLILIAIFVLAILVIWPGTRWIVSRQLRAATLLGNAVGAAKPPTLDEAAYATSIAAANPNDLNLQFAAAYTRASARAEATHSYLSREITAELHQLRPTFSSDPVFCANFLRYTGFLVADFPEEFLLFGSDPNKREMLSRGGSSVVRRGSSTEELEEALEVAREGEKAEPDNAYFPFTSAWSLFALRRDGEGMDAIGRASTCNHWNDYASFEADARIAMAKEMYGSIDSTHSLSIRASVLYPHYAKLRQTARVAIHKDWVVTRRFFRTAQPAVMPAVMLAVMRYGGLMRANSETLIGSLVGASIVDESIVNLVGAIESTADHTNESTVERRHRLRNEYLMRLKVVENGIITDWVREQLDATGFVQDTFERELHFEEMGSYRAVSRTAVVWEAGVLLLCNALIVLALGALALLAGRWKPRRLLWLTRVGLVAITILAVWGYVHAVSNSEAVRLGLFLNWPSIGEYQVAGWWLIPAYVVPVLLVLSIGITSLVCRVKLSTGLARGLRGLAVPVAAVLVLGFAACVLVTARMDAKAQDAMALQSAHEGRYLSSQLGTHWPEAPLPVPVLESGDANVSR